MTQYWAMQGFISGFADGVLAATTFWLLTAWIVRLRRKPRRTIPHFPSTR
jgi:hypothetical protein